MPRPPDSHCPFTSAAPRPSLLLPPPERRSRAGSAKARTGPHERHGGLPAAHPAASPLRLPGQAAPDPCSLRRVPGLRLGPLLLAGSGAAGESGAGPAGSALPGALEGRRRPRGALKFLPRAAGASRRTAGRPGPGEPPRRRPPPARRHSPWSPS